MADDNEKREYSGGVQPVWHKAEDYEKPSEEAKKAKSPLEDGNWRDQSQGPNHPLDENGNKKD
jgi:hypothetical protein